MDVLSDVLRAIRLKGALFLNADLRAPWCVNVPKGAELAKVLAPQAQRLAICHIVLEGRCWVQLANGEPAIELTAGDVVTIPQSDTHVLGSHLHQSPSEVDHVVQPRVPELNLVRYGGDGEQTLVVCGWFAYEGEGTNPLTDALPRLFRTGLRARAAGAWIEQSVRFAVSESASTGAGLEAMVSRTAELLFLEALRGYIDTLPMDNTGWLAGLRDPQVGRCLALMHGIPWRRLDRQFARGGSEFVAQCSGRALREIRGRAAHAVPEALAHDYRERPAPRGTPRPCADRGDGGLRIRSRLQSRVQKRVRHLARSVAATSGAAGLMLPRHRGQAMPAVRPL